MDMEFTGFLPVAIGGLMQYVLAKANAHDKSAANGWLPLSR